MIVRINDHPHKWSFLKSAKLRMIVRKNDRFFFWNMWDDDIARKEPWNAELGHSSKKRCSLKNERNFQRINDRKRMFNVWICRYGRPSGASLEFADFFLLFRYGRPSEASLEFYLYFNYYVEQNDRKRVFWKMSSRFQKWAFFKNFEFSNRINDRPHKWSFFEKTARKCPL